MGRVLPILFNTDMVRAILDGRKTVTRRVIKPQPKMPLCYIFAGCDDGKWDYPSKLAHEHWGDKYKHPDTVTEADMRMKWTPPCHIDDILYVRETWGKGYEDGTYIYKADDKLANLPAFKESSNMIYRPSVHMPKEAARIWLKVMDIRVERLQEINDKEAAKEGFPLEKEIHYVGEGCSTNDFAELWDATIKKSDLPIYGWDANPWVWVIEFERCEKPEEVL